MGRKLTIKPTEIQKDAVAPADSLVAGYNFEEDARVNLKLFEPTYRKIEVRTDHEHGYDFAYLDILTSAYYNKITAYPHFALISPTADSLPFEGFIVPITQWFLTDIIYGLQRCAIEGLPFSDKTPEFPEKVVALQLGVKGKIDADGDYEKGSRLFVKALALETKIIAQWANWCYLDQPWFFRVWDLFGLDRVDPDILRFETRQLWHPESFIPGELPKPYPLFLVIAFLFNHWENRKIPFGGRVLHLQRLGLEHKLDAKTLWTYLAEAGFLTPTRSQTLRFLQKLQGEAMRFFKSNPAALEEQKRSVNINLRMILPAAGRKK